MVKARTINYSGALNRFLFVLANLASLSVASEPLPNPLTLSQALSYANAGQPELLIADAILADTMSRKYQVDADNSVNAYIELAPFMAIPSPQFNDEFTNDSYARLSISKKLYDFGYSDSLENSAEEAILSQELMASETRNWNYLTIMQSFFNVIIADMHFAAANEMMTTLYVQYDKLRDSHSLGMVSDVDLSEAESRYRDAANTRKQSETQQYSSRQQLAIALNRPDDLPADLLKPDLPELNRAKPELSELLNAAYTHNLRLTSLQHEIRGGGCRTRCREAAVRPDIICRGRAKPLRAPSAGT